MYSFDEIKNTIRSEKREKHGVEGMIIGSIIVPLIHFYDYDCYLYGGADWVDALIIYLKELDVNVKAIVDADNRKIGNTAACGVKYISLDELCTTSKPENVFVIITPISLKGIELRDILVRLFASRIEKYYQLESEEIERIIGNSWTGLNSIRYYRQHLEELESSFDLLKDDYSRRVMGEYIRARCEVGIYSLEHIDGRRKYWFGREKEKDLYTHLENEVWINVGANIGDSIFLYFDNGLKAKLIYAFEGDRKTYEQLVHNIMHLPNEYSRNIETYNLMVSENTDFKREIKEKITLINADIEGSELQLLAAIKDIIVSDRPVIAICVYHRPDDLVSIPKYIDDIVDGYHYYLRKYEAYELNSNRAGELVFYAVPNERAALDGKGR